MGSPTDAGQGITPDQAIGRLGTGNARYASGCAEHPWQDPARRADTAAHGQHPFATVIACSDSRVPVEAIFDQGIGDLFVIRVAGNVCGTSETTGSIEYGVEHLGTPVLVVLGHTNCGVVTAAVEGADARGGVASLLEQIKPVVADTRRRNPQLQGDELLDAAIKANVFHTIGTLLTNSPIVAGLIRTGRLTVLGAMYDLRSGLVDWLGPHPEESRLLKAT